MITPITRFGRRTGAVAAALLVAGALACACGTTQVSPAAGSGTGAAASSTPASGATAPAATATATPVPTVSGTVPAGMSACVGWPASVPTGSVPASFVPVRVERCVNGAEEIPGKGLWTTATLEQATGSLTGLVSALRQPAGAHTPGTVCPELAEIPQQIVLTSAAGQQLIPRLPVSGCGLTESGVSVALDALHWRTVSVRLIAQISTATTEPTVTATPRSIQTVGVAKPE